MYEQKLKEQDAQESEEEQLRVFDDPHDQEPNPNANSGKGKAEHAVEETAELIPNASKRKRPLVDPFAGMCTRAFPLGPC